MKMMLNQFLEASDESLDEGFKDDQGGGRRLALKVKMRLEMVWKQLYVVDQQVVGSSQACEEEVLSQFNDLFESGKSFEHDIEYGNNDIFLGGSSYDENDRQFEVVARFGPCSQDTFNLGDPESEKEDEDWDPVDVHSSETSEEEEYDKEMYFVICKDKDCKWFVKCSKKINELTVKLRKYNDIHTCEADEENKVVQAKAP
ncbi:hypothetical protein IFM89_032190 [Coptis chinensis]|uniref:Transposase MuDR plant domain-containing protein n=1 Tax=Coptis chinensis TaxID=261450 RepID=A0A835IYB2_9MAGN|nr:hypothetical protein IFM89_032190 [Coptis chinensis]